MKSKADMSGGAGKTIVFLLLLFALGPVCPLVFGQSSVPFVETFDGLTVGDLGSQNNWFSAPSSQVLVETSSVYVGTQAAGGRTNSIMRQAFAGAPATNVWVDFYVFGHRGGGPEPALNADAAAGFYIDQNGHVVAWDSSAWITNAIYTVPTNAWRRFTVHLDYGTSKWGIYMAGDQPNALSAPVFTNLSFMATTTNTYFQRFSFEN